MSVCYASERINENEHGFIVYLLDRLIHIVNNCKDDRNSNKFPILGDINVENLSKKALTDALLHSLENIIKDKKLHQKVDCIFW